MMKLISGEKYMYRGEVVTFLCVETDGRGTLYLVFEVDGKEKYWEAFVHLNIKPMGQRTHRGVQLPHLNGVVKQHCALKEQGTTTISFGIKKPDLER